MGREPVTIEISGLKATSTPLPFARAQALLPAVADFLTVALQELAPVLGGSVKLTDNVLVIAKQLGRVRLLMDAVVQNAAQILATTSVVMPNIAGELQRYNLGSEAERNAVFDEHPDAFLPTVLHAGKVTFARFFPETALAGMSGAAPAAPMKASI